MARKTALEKLRELDLPELDVALEELDTYDLTFEHDNVKSAKKATAATRKQLFAEAKADLKRLAKTAQTALDNLSTAAAQLATEDDEAIELVFAEDDVDDSDD